jgi:hypothetical protein
VSRDDEETLDYFDLIVTAAQETVRNPESLSSPAKFWQERVGKSWRNVYQHMTRPDPEYGVFRTTQARRETAYRFAALAREAMMAAWYIGVAMEDGAVEPEVVAERFREMGKTMPPFI